MIGDPKCNFLLPKSVLFRWECNLSIGTSDPSVLDLCEYNTRESRMFFWYFFLEYYFSYWCFSLSIKYYESVKELLSHSYSSNIELDLNAITQHLFHIFWPWSLNRQIEKRKRIMRELELNSGPPKHIITKQLLYLLCNGSFFCVEDFRFLWKARSKICFMLLICSPQNKIILGPAIGLFLCIG